MKVLHGNGDLDMRRKAPHASSQASKIALDDSEPPAVPLQDEEAVNVFLALKIVSCGSRARQLVSAAPPSSWWTTL